MNKILCVGLLCAVGASIVAGENPEQPTPKSGQSSLQTSPLRKDSLRDSGSEAIAIVRVAIQKTAAKQEKNTTSSSAGLSVSPADLHSSGSSPLGTDYFFPGQGHVPAYCLPVDHKDPNMNGIWPYYK